MGLIMQTGKKRYKLLASVSGLPRCARFQCFPPTHNLNMHNGEGLEPRLINYHVQCVVTAVFLMCLSIGKVESLQREDVRHVVAISKHLCGAATGKTTPVVSLSSLSLWFTEWDYTVCTCMYYMYIHVHVHVASFPNFPSTRAQKISTKI